MLFNVFGPPAGLGRAQAVAGVSSQTDQVPRGFSNQVLIVAGVISLIVGGSIWEPSDEGAPAAESEPAFGFVPQTPPSSPQ